jgi:hypothetical protein
MEDEFASIMTTTSKEDRESEGLEKTGPISYDLMPWEKVLDRAPANKTVLLVNESNDDLLKKAVGVVFKALPMSEWESRKAQTLINEVYNSMKLEEAKENEDE